MTVALATSCHRSVSEECYESLPRPTIEPTQDPTTLPYCSWTLGTLPAPPEGYGFTHGVSASFIPTEDEPCDPCDVERLDQMLRTAIEEKTSQGSPSCARIDPSEPVRACVHPPDETSDQCVVAGIFFSNHSNIPVEYGCVDCRENDTCPGR